MSQTKTISNTRGQPEYFQAIIAEKSRNFVGRDFVFTAIDNFINQYDKGYFTIVGEPGSGKSAIVAQYFKKNNNNLVYYNCDVCEAALKKKKDEIGDCETFLEIVNHQLREILAGLGIDKIDGELDDNSHLFSLLLQKISYQLSQNQRLIIIVDSCHKLHLNKYKNGANLLYLPRYLPKNVYFILTRRPFSNNQSNLLIETPSKILDLSTCLEKKQKAIQTYLNSHANNLKILNKIDKNEANFMYIREIIKHSDSSTETLPKSLEIYYQEHWEVIELVIQKNYEISLQILKFLLEKHSFVSIEIIAKRLDQDEYDIEIILEQWREFLHLETQDNIEHYRFYHPSFHNWLRQKIVEENLEFRI